MFSVHAPFDAKLALIEKYRGKINPRNPQHSPTYAAMVESMEDAVGSLMDAVDEAGLTDRTIFIFTSDKGFRVEFGAGLTLAHHAGDAALRSVQARAAVDKEQAKWIRWDEDRQRLIVARWTGNARPLTVTIQPLAQP